MKSDFEEIMFIVKRFAKPMQVIYVPTEANLPIMEAGKR